MGDRASAERACREPNPIIDGRKANVNLAILGAKPRGNVQTGKFHLFIIIITGRLVVFYYCFTCPSHFNANTN